MMMASSNNGVGSLSERTEEAADHAFGASSIMEFNGSRATIRFCSGLPLAFDAGKPLAPVATGWRNVQLLLKRGLDIILGLAALVVLSPLLIATVIIIRTTSKGPAVFRQDRHGLNGKIISIYKFRSMYADLGDTSGVQQTCDGDERVTPFGSFIRRTSIDELPQLLNVIKGDMSLVGPRPHALGMLAADVAYDVLVPYYHARDAMRPGLSGWAQANGLRGPTNDADLAKARVDHDIAYIQNFSIMVDFKIMLRTLQHEFLTGSGV